MKVVHIGMGKCATTTLQKIIFPKLEEMIDINYLSNLNGYLGHAIHTSLTDKRADLIKKFISNYQNIFISFEGLLGANLCFWELQADENLKLFGSETQIIITLREPYDLLRSLYQQNIHFGSIVEPQNFFLSNEEYNSIRKLECDSYCKYFNVDGFDYEKLYSIYKERFKKVYIVSMVDIKKMYFLKDIFNLNSSQIRILQDLYLKSPHYNASYSQLGMKLTFARENLLNFFGLKSIHDIDLRANPWLLYRDDEYIFKRFTNLEKNSFFKRVINRIKKYISWRYFIQNILDKLPFIATKEYELPPKIYLNQKLIEKNRKFLNKFKS